MKNIFISHVDNLLSKTPLLNKIVERVGNLILPKGTALAACSHAYFCGTTWTGAYCLNECQYYQGTCQRLKSRRMNIWTDDQANCYGMCSDQTGCEAVTFSPCSFC